MGGFDDSDFGGPPDASATNDAHFIQAIVISSNVLHSAGLVLALVILSTTLISTRIHKLSTHIILLISLIFMMLFTLILAIGQGQGEIKPAGSLCLFQSVLLEFAPIWICFATAAHALQVYQASRGFLGSLVKHKRVYRFWLIAAPITLALIVLVVSAGTAFEYKERRMEFKAKIKRDPFNVVCRTSNETALAVAYSFAGVALAVALFFTAMLIRILSERGWLKEIDLGPRQGTITRSTVVRLTLMIAFLVSFIALKHPYDQGDDGNDGNKDRRGQHDVPLDAGDAAKQIVLSLWPLLMTLVLGVESDILGVWMFWRSDEPAEDDSSEVEKGVWTIPKSAFSANGTDTRFISLSSPHCTAMH
jgi:hypothetical protein